MSATADLPPTAGVVDLTFRRVLKAPIANAWAAWADPSRFAAWFGPHGATMEPCELDVRPGGGGRRRSGHPEFGEVWVRGEYVAVEPPRRLVMLFGFADEHGEPQPRAGFAATSRVEVILEATDDATTAMTVRHTGLSRDQGETEGWRQGFERLDALLAAG